MTPHAARPARLAPQPPTPPPSAQILRDTPFPHVDDAVLARLDQPGPRYTSYPTVPVWREAGAAEIFSDALARASLQAHAPLSLYVHVPFCHHLCSYCGCNVVVTRDQARVTRYLAALEAELTLVAAQLGARRRLARVHLGGGTPTFLDEAQLTRLWRAITAHFVVTADAEVSIEVEPVTTTLGQLAHVRALGFGRLSLGVQDLDPAVQAAVDRHQSLGATARVIHAARDLGFTSVNVDLIYGLPRQTPTGWARTLDEVVALAPDRLAVFSFAYLPALRPNQRRLPVAELPQGRAKLALLAQAHERLRAAGYGAIGLDHFARPDDELARAFAAGTLGRDFQGYTARGALETVGVGASAISWLGGAYAQNDKGLGGYGAAIARGAPATVRAHALDADDLRRRELILSLMCNEHADLGADAATRFCGELTRLRRLEDDGLVTLTDGRHLALTPLGRVFARNVAMVFDAYLRAGAAGFSRTV